MFEVLVREAAARYGLGDKALPLLQIVLHYMTKGGARGFAEFLEKFKEAGLGPVVQSWLGGGPVAKPISNEELDGVLGSSDGLISTLTHKLELDRNDVTSALGYLLPSLVGKLTPGGSLPSRIPPEVQALAAEGKNRLEAPATRAPVAASSGGAMKWLPWVIVALAVVLGLGYCSTRDKGGDVAPAIEESSAPAAPADTQDDAAVAEQPAAEPASTPDETASGTDAATEDDAAVDDGTDGLEDGAAAAEDAAAEEGVDGSSAADTADTDDADDTGAADDAATNVNADDAQAAEPEAGAESTDDAQADAEASVQNDDGSTAADDEAAAAADEAAGASDAAGPAVEALTIDGKPALKVYFDSGDATVPGGFSEQAQAMFDYLNEHADAKLHLSGFTDASGSAELNERLAKERANAVLAALVMGGVDESRVTLEKPLEVSGADDDGDQATSRRVEVTISDAD